MIDVLERVKSAGITLRPAPDGRMILAAPKSRLTDELRAMIREHRYELLRALTPASEVRRQRAIRMLDENPEIRYAAVTDSEIDPENVVLTLAVRGVGTVEVLIPAEKWDGVLFLELLDRHSIH